MASSTPARELVTTLTDQSAFKAQPGLDGPRVSDQHEEGQRDEPLPPKFNLRVIAGIIVGGGVVATELLWPGAAAAIHDGAMIVASVILSARRRRD